MCCKSWKIILPFAVTFLVGIFAVNMFLSKSQKVLGNSTIYSNYLKVSLNENENELTVGCLFGSPEKTVYKLNLQKSFPINHSQSYVDTVFEPKKDRKY